MYCIQQCNIGSPLKEIDLTAFLSCLSIVLPGHFLNWCSITLKKNILIFHKKFNLVTLSDTTIDRGKIGGRGDSSFPQLPVSHIRTCISGLMLRIRAGPDCYYP